MEAAAAEHSEPRATIVVSVRHEGHMESDNADRQRGLMMDDSRHGTGHPHQRMGKDRMQPTQ